MLSLCLVIQRCLRGTPLGFCLKVIVNEKLLNLEMATSNVLSVLFLIYSIQCSGEYSEGGAIRILSPLTPWKSEKYSSQGAYLSPSPPKKIKI